MSTPDADATAAETTQEETRSTETPATVHAALADGGCVLARLHRPRSATPTTLAVVADPHVSTGATGTWKLFHRTRRRFMDALAEIEALGADGLVVAGDLTKDGAPADLDWAADALASIDVPSLVVPGNHDVKKVPVAAFEDRFAGGGYPTAARLGGVDVVGLNTAMVPAAEGEERVEGAVTPAQLDRLDEHLRRADEPVVVSHHNLPGVDVTLAEHAWDPHPPIDDASALADRLEAVGVPLHLSGHVHVLSHSIERGVGGLVAPALASFPQVYLLLEIDATGTTVRCRTPADPAGVEEAYRAAREGSARSRAVADANAELLADLPLVEEGWAGVEPVASSD